MTPTPPTEISEAVRFSLSALANAVREMSAAGSLPIPASPSNFNMLARPHYRTCQVCGLPGHESSNIYTDNIKCRVGVISTIGFWELMAEHLTICFNGSERFNFAVNKLEPKYEMRLASASPVPGGLEVVLVDHLCKAWLGFLAYCARMKPKFAVFLDSGDARRLENVTKVLNELFFGGLTFSELFERSGIAQR